jgi:DNA-binding YbaB/EbfC family protein
MANPFKNAGGGGGGLGGPGMAAMLKGIQEKMLADAEKMNQKLDETRIDGTAGGGAVKVTVDGHGHLVEVKIKPEAVDPEDVATLEDLVAGAVRQAWEKAEDLKTEEQRKLMPAGIPGLPGLL